MLCAFVILNKDYLPMFVAVSCSGGVAIRYVCMNVTFVRCDRRTNKQIINIKSKVRMIYNTKPKNRKLFHSTKLHKQRMTQDFL